MYSSGTSKDPSIYLAAAQFYMRRLRDKGLSNTIYIYIYIMGKRGETERERELRISYIEFSFLSRILSGQAKAMLQTFDFEFSQTHITFYTDSRAGGVFPMSDPSLASLLFSFLDPSLHADSQGPLYIYIYI
jgi:hypothetical protein